MDQEFATTTSVSLEIENVLELSKFGLLQRKGQAFSLAWELANILQLELLRNFDFCQFTDITVRFITKFGQAPPDWKQRVNGSKINMTNLGFFEGNFVIWGEVQKHKEYEFQPFILLACLTFWKEGKALQVKGEIPNILEMLKLYIRNDEYRHSDKFYELKDRLDEILPDLEKGKIVLV